MITNFQPALVAGFKVTKKEHTFYKKEVMPYSLLEKRHPASCLKK